MAAPLTSKASGVEFVRVPVKLIQVPGVTVWVGLLIVNTNGSAFVRAAATKQIAVKATALRMDLLIVVIELSLAFLNLLIL
jgi:hypothetical protein